MALRGALFGAVGLAGAYIFISFFTSGNSGLSKKADEEKRAASTPGIVAQPSESTNPIVSMPGLPVKAGAPDPLESLSQEQRYVAALSDRHRVRLALTASFGDRQIGMVEWVDSSGNPVEELASDALVAPGHRIRLAPYGSFPRIGAKSFRPLRDYMDTLVDSLKMTDDGAGILGFIVFAPLVVVFAWAWVEVRIQERGVRNGSNR